MTDIDKTAPIRKFDSASIQGFIDKNLAALEAKDPNARGAVVAYLDKGGASVAIMGKKDLGGGQLAWTVVATKPWDGKFEAEAAVRYSW